MDNSKYNMKKVLSEILQIQNKARKEDSENKSRIKKEEESKLPIVIHDVYYTPPKPHLKEARFLGSAQARTFEEAINIVCEREEVRVMFPELRNNQGTERCSE